MKLNMRPSRVAFLDFETQSEAELTTVHKFAAHPTTRALTCCVKVDGRMHRFGPGLDAAAKEQLSRITEGRTVAAHNAPFDAAIWELEGLPEREWFDTLPCARAAGFPGKLDELSRIITGRGKDPNGKRLLEMLCILRRGRRPPPDGPVYQLLLDYNARDVEELESIYSRVKDFGEPDVIAVDRAINDRGVPLDQEYLQQLLDVYVQNREKLEAEFAELTGGINVNSPKQMRAWLLSRGFEVDSISKLELAKLIADPSKYFVGDEDMDAALESVLEAVEYRKELAGIGESKVEAALAGMDADGRIREQFVYWGAHTGRWSGRKLQLHNIPRGAFDCRFIEPTYGAAAAKAAELSTPKRRVMVQEVLAAMIRRMVKVPNCLTADYGAVEARGIAYVAGCERMLALFRDPSKSVYLDMAKQVFGREVSKKEKLEYNFAKILVLGCGYGMSAPKFLAGCRNKRVECVVDARAAVRAYRETYAEIPAVWKAYHEALHAAAAGHSTYAGKCDFCMVGSDLHIVLPSGRPIVFRNARVEPRVPGYCALYGMPAKAVPTVVYDKPRLGLTGFLYGSKVAENIVQGVCRDMLSETLVNWERAGLTPFLHVHDEGVCCEDDRRFAEFCEIMSTPPAWAPDFPVLIEAYSGPQWAKASEGWHEDVYLCGKSIRTA
jgi:DNA polymerase